MKPNQRATVYTLLQRNTPQREIARITGIDRKTVRSYQRRWLAERSNSPGVATGPDAVASQIPPPWPPTPTSVATSLCDPHRDFIEAQLRLKRNAMAIHQDLVDQYGFAGQYNSVKRFVAKLRHKEPEQFDRLSFLPGEEMQVDYGEGAPTRMPSSDRYRKPRLFVATLLYSRASFRCVVWKSEQVWAELHERAFRHFGGCPQYVVLDNLKEGVITPDLYEPELNKVYAATLAHYGVLADPARVRDPNRKGTVEHAIGHTQSTALKGRRFESLEAQNEFLAHWERSWAAKRIHGTEHRQVQAMFEEERAHLKPLPLLGMQYFEEVERTVCDDSCVRVQHSSYAARPAAIGSKVLVRIYAQRLEIRDIHSGNLLRTHAKAERPGTVVLPQDERVFNPSRETRLILRQAGEIGEHAARLCQLLFAIEGRVGQRKLWGIVGLVRRYPAHCVNAACAQALVQGVYSYKRVHALTEAIFSDAITAIETHAPSGCSHSDTTPALIQQHELIRDAHEYGDLFAHAAATAMFTTVQGERA